jgi:ferredoxin
MIAERNKAAPRTHYFLGKADLGALVETLRADEYTVIAPSVHDDVIRLRPIESAEQIAHGLRDEQDGGHYRLTPGDESSWFEYVVGPDSPRRFLSPPRRQLFSLTVRGEEFIVSEPAASLPKYAFVAVRPCELAAVAIRNRVHGIAEEQQTFRCESDPSYRDAVENALFIAVNCTHPGGTCFCDSMGTGPAAREGFDLALTELKIGFLVEVGSERGAALAGKLPVREPSAAEIELAELKLNNAREHMGRRLETGGLVEALDGAVEHERWKQVAQRCLSCTNCTLVCPTCFCSTVLDTTDLASGQITRWQQWESCFTHQFSYTTGGEVRTSIRARYRHWLRHKLGTWWEQFGTSGCVGCGRCITWCPVGIDITEEAAAIRHAAPPQAKASGERGIPA